VNAVINWQVYATLSAPLITLFLGIAINRAIEKRARLISFLLHATGVPFQPPTGEPFNVNSHTIVVRNAGRKAANNVRLRHHFLPENFTVFPAVNYQVLQLENTAREIVLPTLVPNEQILVTYLYFSPITFSQINSYTKSDEGFAKIVNVLPSPQPSKWQRYGLRVLEALGAITLLYALGSLAIWGWVKAFGP